MTKHLFIVPIVLLLTGCSKNWVDKDTVAIAEQQCTHRLGWNSVVADKYNADLSEITILCNDKTLIVYYKRK